MRTNLYQRFTESINFLWETESFLWEKHYELLVKVQTQKKNPDDPTAFRRWVSRQRDAFRDGALAQDRIDRLNAVGFHWGDSSTNGSNISSLYNTSPASASSSLAHDESPQPNSAARSSGSYGRESGSSRRNASTHLHGDGARAARHPPQNAKRAPASALETWNANFKALTLYKKEHGHANVDSDDRRHSLLALWCKDIRALHRRKELGPDKVRKLRNLGFRWANRKTGPKASWDERFSQLKVLLRQHHGMENLLHYAAAAESLRSKNDDPSLLETIVSWVDYQRVLRKHNKLDQDKIERLTAVGLVWDAHQAAWDARYKQLVELTERGTKPRDYSSYVKWEHRQRREFRLGTLNHDRIARLNAIGFRWEPRPTRRRASNQSYGSNLMAEADHLVGQGDDDGDAYAHDIPDPRRQSSYSLSPDDGNDSEGDDDDDDDDGNFDEEEEEGRTEFEDAYGQRDDSDFNEGSYSVSSVEDSRRGTDRRGTSGLYRPAAPSSRKRASAPSFELGDAGRGYADAGDSPAASDYSGPGSAPASHRRANKKARTKDQPSLSYAAAAAAAGALELRGRPVMDDGAGMWNAAEFVTGSGSASGGWPGDDS
jgi:hypothetical protein